MTPTAPQLLNGCLAALSTPTSAEETGAFAVGKIAIAAMLDALAAQECATGSAVRVWENAALRTVLAEAAAPYDKTLGASLGSAAEIGDGDYSLAALDQANAELRRRLIGLHEKVEAAGDHDLDRRILALYREMAVHRMLHLPGTG
jgi:hypothetical protein